MEVFSKFMLFKITVFWKVLNLFSMKAFQMELD